MVECFGPVPRPPAMSSRQRNTRRHRRRLNEVALAEALVKLLVCLESKPRAASILFRHAKR